MIDTFGPMSRIRRRINRGLLAAVWLPIALLALATASILPAPAPTLAQDGKPVPAAPKHLKAIAGNGSATITWGDPADPSIAKYQARYREDGKAEWSEIP